MVKLQPYQLFTSSFIQLFISLFLSQLGLPVVEHRGAYFEGGVNCRGILLQNYFVFIMLRAQ